MLMSGSLGLGVGAEWISYRHKGTSEGDGGVPELDCGGGFMLYEFILKLLYCYKR